MFHLQKEAPAKRGEPPGLAGAKAVVSTMAETKSASCKSASALLLLLLPLLFVFLSLVLGPSPSATARASSQEVTSSPAAFNANLPSCALVTGSSTNGTDFDSWFTPSSLTGCDFYSHGCLEYGTAIELGVDVHGVAQVFDFLPGLCFQSLVVMSSPTTSTGTRVSTFSTADITGNR